MNPLYSSNYAFKVLTDAIRSIDTALTDWDVAHYPEAYKRQQKKLRQLKEARDKIGQ